LLFTEIYLDRYFRDPQALLAVLNQRVIAWNVDKPEAEEILPFNVASEAWPQLNKLAFWMATGSGKTLVMHANILQFQHYLDKHGRQRELTSAWPATPAARAAVRRSPRHHLDGGAGRVFWSR
jgi:hypothetical protein